ncbi:hypothetical protein MTR_8g100090 [Medicago truncatula]|uniref:Uncharacterized protein n=1 Tax=Medicago truncatula TaxID=3880 RepID=G7LIT6_MEDTR|nr:hypothetical protein MTR_8g100090 [Medicago truncatula]
MNATLNPTIFTCQTLVVLKLEKLFDCLLLYMIYDMSILYTRGEHNADSSVDVVGFLAKYSQWPAVTLGPNWC